MNYSETLEFLFAQLPVFQRDGAKALDFKLDRILHFMEYLGKPHKGLNYIHVAGTNGKGSVSHAIASILQHAGYRTGLYTSPHLKDFRERIKVNGDCISQPEVIGFVARHKDYINEFRPSFFELTVAMAFDYYARQELDFAVIEVGMGGRLDSTNIITPVLSVITNISFDHKEFLGDTLEQIAFEKAGIIKSAIPVVIGEFHPDTLAVFERLALERNAPIYKAFERVTPEWLTQVELFDLQGPYQSANRKTVFTAIEVLRSLGIVISEDALRHGLQHAAQTTGLLGRWQWIDKNILCDTAHNQAGLAHIMERITSMGYTRLHLVIGVVKDKDLSTILPLFPKTALYYFVAPHLPRALPSHELKDIAATYGLIGSSYSSVESGYSAARQAALENELVFVGGSTFTVAEIV